MTTANTHAHAICNTYTITTGERLMDTMFEFAQNHPTMPPEEVTKVFRCVMVELVNRNQRSITFKCGATTITTVD